MEITSNRDGGTLHITVHGDLDHHAARVAIPEISKLIDVELPLHLTLDFDGVSFMDSSGIALVIGSYKKATAFGGTFSLINVPGQAYKVFSTAGICKLINISAKNPAKASI